MHAIIPGNGRGLKLVFRSLRHRNYRLFFIGQGLSLVGTWMQSVAVSWLVFRLTQSEFILGLVAFAGQIPAIFISPFAGVLGDRLSRRRILVAMQVLAMVQAVTLAVVDPRRRYPGMADRRARDRARHRKRD